ncbi:MAG: prolyl oligopeptidase family serine peptidase [Planctomycetaceae bacterium]
MPIPVQCPDCGFSKSVADTFAGKAVKCKSCGGRIPVPAGTDDDKEAPRSTSSRTGRPNRSAKSSIKSPAKSNTPWVIIGIMCTGGLVTAIICAGIAFSVFSQAKSGQWSNTHNGNRDPSLLPSPAEPAGSSPSLSLTDLSTVPIPSFPPLGEPIETFSDSGVKLYFVDFNSVPGNNPVGGQMKMRVYIPSGTHDPGTLPCVLVGPAGTNLLTGCDMDADDYHEETLPYAEAGMVTVFYSLDGGIDDIETIENYELTKAYRQFRSAHAGVMNGRNALEFILAQVPSVNPKKIYCAGHSSAGTLSLLLAAREPRIAACAAYAPATDVEARLAEVLQDPAANLVLPGIRAFLKDSSPKNHLDEYHCPVFLFHAADDDNVPISDPTAFYGSLIAKGKTAKLETVAHGGHYQPMIDEGIPRAIRWFQSLPPAE